MQAEPGTYRCMQCGRLTHIYRKSDDKCGCGAGQDWLRVERAVISPLNSQSCMGNTLAHDHCPA